MVQRLRRCLQRRGHGHGFNLWFRKIPQAEGQLGPHTTTTETAVVPESHSY